MRLALFESHPIQYFAPLWRRLAAEPGVDLVVHFFSDHSVRGDIDPGFGVPVAWDVPLLEGYEHHFITRNANLAKPGSVRIPDPQQLLKQGKFDAVLFSGYRYAYCRQLAVAARRLKLRSIIRGEFNDGKPYRGRSFAKKLLREMYLRWLYPKIDAFCFIGEAARQHLARRNVPAEKMFFSPYTVDNELLERQRKTYDRPTVRQEIGLAEEDFVLLFSGKLIPRKAPLLVIEALSKLPVSAKVTLMVLGDGELRAAMENLGKQRLAGRLRMMGFVNQSEIGKYFAAADAFVLPSEFETWGLVVNEAMLFGLPVIVSQNVGCHQDLVINGETGFTFCAGNARQLASCIERLSADRQRAITMGKKAIERIANYSTETAAQGILSALRA